MIGLYTDTPEFFSELCEEIRLFFKVREISKLMDPEAPDGVAVIHRAQNADGFYSCCEVYRDRVKLSFSECRNDTAATTALDKKKYAKRTAKQAVFRAMKKAFCADTPWGSLTGVRPTKLFRELTLENGESQAKEIFAGEFDVSPKKIELARSICAVQSAVIGRREEKCDVYIGIPFCPTRCAYCSFASNDIRKAVGSVDAYLDALIYEMDRVKGALDFDVRCVYIGGGTPTALDAPRLERLLCAVDRLFPDRAEYTVEAGRPDTIDREKLTAMRGHGVSRISVNPQTLNDATLERIGRKHSAGQFVEAFLLARECGFEDINADLIAGLPGEDAADAAATIDRLLSLQPDSVTVHTLSIKRASAFAEMCVLPEKGVADMVELFRKRLCEAGFHPYYMYRQKYMGGNLENTGYCRENRECVYNIDIMEELSSIVAFGAGAITKLVIPEENRIERAPNVSDLGNYLERTEEMAERKLALFRLTQR